MQSLDIRTVELLYNQRKRITEENEPYNSWLLEIQDEYAKELGTKYKNRKVICTDTGDMYYGSTGIIDAMTFYADRLYAEMYIGNTLLTRAFRVQYVEFIDEED